MASYVKFHCFVEDLAEKVHNLGSDDLTVALTDTGPTVATDHQLSDITQIDNYANCSARVISRTSSSQTDGTYSLVLVDLTLTATGDVGPFQYVVIYNDTATNDELICYYDYGSSISLASGETFKLDFGANALTIA